jgi:choline dehydrogenase-like flavoprotein
MQAPKRTDAVIVGAGAAGNLFAAVLAEAGKSVLVLDPGPAWKSGDLYSSSIWSRRLRWGGPPVESTGANAFGAGFNMGWGTGGAALHHYGTWPRLMPTDFTMKSEFGKGLDWPIGYDDLRPFYDRVQEEVGVSGDAEAEVWRPAGAPYPLPPLQQFAQARLLAKGFHAKGMKTAPSPMAILSEDYKGRPACLYDGWCDAGCPIGALANPLVTYHPRAVKGGARSASPFRCGGRSCSVCPYGACSASFGSGAAAVAARALYRAASVRALYRATSV